MNENHIEQSGHAQAEAQAAAARAWEMIGVDGGTVPDHIRRALDDGAPGGVSGRHALGWGLLVLALLVAVGGVAWAFGLVPSPVAFLP